MRLPKSTEITRNHPTTGFASNRGNRPCTRLNIAVSQYWCYFRDALAGGGESIPPARTSKPGNFTSASHFAGALVCSKNLDQLRLSRSSNSENRIGTKRRRSRGGNS